ncbi:MAG: hypothetical protein WBO35_00315 [Candidatus Saccharimonadales bacterium]
MTSPEFKRTSLRLSEETVQQYHLIAEVKDEQTSAVLRGAFAHFFDSEDVATPYPPAERLEAESFTGSEAGKAAFTAWYGRLEALEPKLQISKGYRRGDVRNMELGLPTMHAQGLRILQDVRSRRLYPAMGDLGQLVGREPSLGQFIDSEAIRKSVLEDMR